MQNPSSSSNRPPRRLFSLRTLGIGLIGIAALATLIALFYAEEDWRGKHDWEKYRQQAEARGIELNWEKFTPPQVPDEQNFAMTPFLAPLFDLNPKPYKDSPFRDTNAVQRAHNFATNVIDKYNDNEVGTLTDLPTLALSVQRGSNAPVVTGNISNRVNAASFLLTNLKQYQPVLDELRAAGERPYSRYNIPYEYKNPAEILLPHLWTLKRVTRLLQIKASSELTLGKTDSAFDDVQLMFRLADSIQTEPFLISQLVRFAILNITKQVIWEGLAEHRWTDAQLQVFQTTLRKLSLLKDARLALQSERAGFGVKLMEFVRDNPAILRTALSEKPGSPEGDVVLLSYAPIGWLYQEQITHQKLLDEKLMPGFDSEAAVIHPRILDEFSTGFTTNAPGPVSRLLHHRVMADLLASSLAKFCQKAALAQTGMDQTDIACALERNRLAGGKLPQTLESLVPKYLLKIPLDVCNGQPLKYHRTNDGQFLLYSVGWNEKDNGGAVVMTQDKKPIVDMTQGDWVWPAYPSM